jgi:hypothetical protein
VSFISHWSISAYSAISRGVLVLGLDRFRPSEYADERIDVYLRNYRNSA